MLHQTRGCTFSERRAVVIADRMPADALLGLAERSLLIARENEGEPGPTYRLALIFAGRCIERLLV